jgi:anaerobic ribonucleoside-triphosphate reductase
MSKLIHFYADDGIEDFLREIPKMEKSKFIREAIHEKMINYTPEKKLEKSKKLREEAEQLEKQVKQQLREQRNKIKNLSGAKKKHIKETIEIIKNKGNFPYLEGRRNHYNNTFREKINRQEFEELIKENGMG